MADHYRVLVSCPKAWDGLEKHRSLFEEHRISIEVPEVTGQQLNEEELLEILGDFDGIIAGDDHLTRRVIESAPRLRVISKWGVGIDAIDIAAAEEHGVVVKNTPGMFADELADYALGFILLIARRQHEVDRDVRTGEWPSPRGHSLAGRTIGIVGLGSSGSALASRAEVMGLEVVGADPFRMDLPEGGAARLVDLDELLSVSDIISLHAPAQPDGRAIIDREAIARSKRGFWLVNTSRGSLVDEEALVSGLETGQVGAAALDVFREEPVDSGHPLLSQPNVILGAHNGSNTHEAVQRTTAQAILNLIDGLSSANEG